MKSVSKQSYHVYWSHITLLSFILCIISIILLFLGSMDLGFCRHIIYCAHWFSLWFKVELNDHTTYSGYPCSQLTPQYTLWTIQTFVLFFNLVHITLNVNWDHQSVIAQDSSFLLWSFSLSSRSWNALHNFVFFKILFFSLPVSAGQENSAVVTYNLSSDSCRTSRA